MVEQANELILDFLPLSAQTARLVRVYGTAPCVALPGTLPAPAGGSFALTELGDYCFSEKPRSLPAADALCRYAVGADGTVRLTRAFGQAVGQKPAGTILTSMPRPRTKRNCTRCAAAFWKKPPCRTVYRSLAAALFTTAAACACSRWAAGDLPWAAMCF